MSHSFKEEFERLYNENHVKVYNLSLDLTGSIADAEKITQEAFYRAYRSYFDFRKDSSFFTWIYRLTLNIADDYMKQRNNQNLSKDSDTLLHSKEVRYKCLHCLTEYLEKDQRKIFCLAITIGLPLKMVAEIMECSLSQVKTTLHTAKQRWFGYMENRCDLIEKTNPCHCSQSKVRTLRALKDVYTTLYPAEISDLLTERIRKGIWNNEWTDYTSATFLL